MALARNPGKPEGPLVVHLIPHTHWDREWYLPQGGFRARLVPALDGLIALLDGDPRLPGFQLDGQTVLLEDYLAVRPERRDLVADLVRAGRLDTGPWYVLADEQIPSGEALLRNLELGRRDVERLGRGSRVLYSPDAFGHPGVLPALGLEFGCTGAVVWRGLDPAALGGRDLAWWRTPDGRRLLVYHLPRDGYEIGVGLVAAGSGLRAEWERVRMAVLPRAATRHVAVLVGADHHAADPALVSLPERLAPLDPTIEFRLSRLEDFLAAAAAEAGDLTEIAGELRSSRGYTWSLQGVHGTRAPLKRRAARVELLLGRDVEPLLARGGPLDPAAQPGWLALLERAWRELVRCHFHDTIGGCSADPVAAAAHSRLDDAEAAGQVLAADLLHRLAGHDPDRAREGAPTEPRLLVWNGVARARGGVVVAEATFFRRDVPVGPSGSARPRTGRGFGSVVLRDPARPDLVIAPQILSVTRGLERRDAARHYPDQDEVDRVRLAFPLPGPIPGLTLATLTPEPGRAVPEEAFTGGDGRIIWNGRIAARVEPAGTIAVGVGAGAKLFGGLLGLESATDRGDTYTFAPGPGRVQRPGRRVRPRATANGPLVAGLGWDVDFRAGRGEGEGPGRIAAGVTIELVGDNPVLHCRLALENRARDHRLRLRFPLRLRGVAALAGAQFGSVARAPVPRPGRGGMETPVVTAPAHRWVAAARGRRGLVVFAPGFFEYEWTRGGDLLVTLLRAVGQLSKSDLPTRPGHAGWPTPTPAAQCLGREQLHFGLALVTAQDLATPARLDRLWEDTFLPPRTVWLRDACVDRAPADPGGVELVGEGLVFSACLPAGEPGTGAMLLRCYNPGPAECPGAWRFGRPVLRATVVRADRTPVALLMPEDAGRTVSFAAAPGAMVSMVVEPARP